MNTIGHLFRVTTWGESHGKAIGVIIDGCPPGIIIDENKIQEDLDRRKPGAGIGVSKRNEADKLEILSGVFEGKTLGTPISMLVWNTDQKPEDYEKFRTMHREGHADLTYEIKYGIRDHRGGGRASGRETVARVMAGSIAKLILPKVKIESFINSVGASKSKIPSKELTGEMVEAIKAAEKTQETLGGSIEIHIKNLPGGLGSPVFGKLQAELAKAILSVGAVRSFEYEDGINGGISNGKEIKIKISIKAPSSKKIGGRHDVCLIPRICVVLESMIAIILADQYLMQRAIR